MAATGLGGLYRSFFLTGVALPGRRRMTVLIHDRPDIPHQPNRSGNFFTIATRLFVTRQLMAAARRRLGDTSGASQALKIATVSFGCDDRFRQRFFLRYRVQKAPDSYHLPSSSATINSRGVLARRGRVVETAERFGWR